MEYVIVAIVLIGRPAWMWFALQNFIPVMIWMERKGSAYIQDRIGPNRAHIGPFRLAGMIHNIADVIKLMTKEDIIPSHVNKSYYLAAPFVAMTVALLTYAVIPFADTLVISEKWTIPMQGANLSVGFLYIFAISSLAVYAIVMAGWASNSKYGLLGGLRSSAQMVSYEVTLGLSIIGLVMVFGTVELNLMVQRQGDLLLGAIPMWGIIIQPLGFVLYLICAFAETNRNPFDLPEGESEIVAGYHVEYSSMKFALFFMAEYVNILVQAAIIATLFLGGWQLPWVTTEIMKENIGTVLTVICVLNTILFFGAGIILYRYHLTNQHSWRDMRRSEGKWLSLLCFAGGITFLVALSIVVNYPPENNGAWAAVWTAAIQCGVFFTKLLLVAWLFIWVRWTLPRFRYDQLMKLGWQYMLPIALANLLLTAFVLMFFERVKLALGIS